MGLHLFNVKQLFVRRKYARVVGRQQDEERMASPSSTHQHHIHYKNTQINKFNGQHYHPNTQAQEMSSEHAKFSRSAATATAASSPSSSSSSSSILWGFKMRPKLRMRKQKSLKFVSTSSNVPPPSQAAVQNFLQGPSQGKGEDEVYQQQCRDLLRKLSARGNRVPGFI